MFLTCKVGDGMGMLALRDKATRVSENLGRPLRVGGEEGGVFFG